MTARGEAMSDGVARHGAALFDGAASEAMLTPRRTISAPGRGERSGKPRGGASKEDRAWRSLFREKTLRTVRRWVRRLGVPETDIRDVTQAVMLEAIKSFPTYDPCVSRPERWLNAIAFHTALHHKERAQHRYEVLQDDSNFPALDERAGADELTALKEDIDLRESILGALPRHLASVLIDHDSHEIPMAQVAAARGIPLLTAYKWRCRALREARKLALAARRARPKPRHAGCPIAVVAR